MEIERKKDSTLDTRFQARLGNASDEALRRDREAKFGEEDWGTGAMNQESAHESRLRRRESAQVVMFQEFSNS